MKLIFTYISIFLLLVACSGQNDPNVPRGKYGLLSKETPQYNAVLFVRSIYLEPNLDKAVELSTERFGRILRGYHTNKNVQRQLLNLRLDDVTETEPVTGGAQLFTERKEQATIEVKIIGNYNGKKHIELKTLSMVNIKGDWRVNKVSNTVP